MHDVDLPVIALPNGTRLVLKSHQQMGWAHYVMKEIFRNQSYMRPGFDLRPTDTVVDIGGNIGMFALWAAPQVARVISIEPTRNIECLEHSLALNGIKNVQIVPCAVSSQPGTLELLEYPGFNGVTHASNFTPAKWGQRLINWLWPKEQESPLRVTCQCQTLDEILEQQQVDRVDFLKVDCEGGEYDLFDSVEESTLARIHRIALEYHELHPSHDHRRIVQRLQSCGFEVVTQRSLLDRWLLQTGMLWAIRRD